MNVPVCEPVPATIIAPVATRTILGGCLCCASYGDEEQKKRASEKLVFEAMRKIPMWIEGKFYSDNKTKTITG